MRKGCHEQGIFCAHEIHEEQQQQQKSWPFRLLGGEVLPTTWTFRSSLGFLHNLHILLCNFAWFKYNLHTTCLLASPLYKERKIWVWLKKLNSAFPKPPACLIWVGFLPMPASSSHWNPLSGCSAHMLPIAAEPQQMWGGPAGQWRKIPCPQPGLYDSSPSWD